MANKANELADWLRTCVQLEMEKFKFIGRISMFIFPLISSCCAFRIELCVLIIGFVALFSACSMHAGVRVASIRLHCIVPCSKKREKKAPEVEVPQINNNTSVEGVIWFCFVLFSGKLDAASFQQCESISCMFGNIPNLFGK